MIALENPTGRIQRRLAKVMQYHGVLDNKIPLIDEVESHINHIETLRKANP